MNVVISEPLGVSIDGLRALAGEKLSEDLDLSVFETPPKNDAEYISRCMDADVLIIANNPLNRSVIEALPNLKFVSVAFTGVDHVDLEACRERGIHVSNCAGYSTPAVAELAIGLMISVYRHIPACDTLIRTGGTRAGHVGRELFGKTLGIVGTGAIGMRTASLAKAFGMNIIAYSRSKTREAEDLGIEYKSLQDVFSESDIVTVHVPLNEHTVKLVNKDLIDSMKPSAVLVNTARGPIVDNEALAAALNDGRLSGAGIDVFEMEPPIPAKHPLFGAPGVTVLPHVAFATREALERRAFIAFDNIAGYLDGKQINSIL
ncbi:MAG: hydroxyacid dehydrogenase [Peptostreptococcaceae bacterium]|nr:hydroxyacid dehydrogenase [Peptostreptococcaceae bacterium]